MSSTSRTESPVWQAHQPSPLPTGAPKEQAAIVIVGTGPVGLALALDLALQGLPVIVLGRLEYVAGGSKAICFAKRSLDILNRLGVGEAAVEKGVVWNVGKVFWQDRPDPIYQFDMLPVKDQKMPGFINLQQYHMEVMLLEKLATLPNVDIRWGHTVTAVTPAENSSKISIETKNGKYCIDANWLVACDGCRSPIRFMLGLDFDGRVFEDNFLIADIRMHEDRAPERWFWFDPPFHPGQSALMHKQPDNIWRLDFQLGPDADRDVWVNPETVDPLIRALLGDDVEYEPVWYSVYTFQCRRMARFVHDRVIFAGDSAHLVSPFGARGCNGGFADADNLGWKLGMILREEAGPALLDSYNNEAITTADENILNSTRSTDFLTPKSAVSVAFRDAVLQLSRHHPFARSFVNSGRLSTPVCYPFSPLNTPDVDVWQGGIAPGSPMIDAPTGAGWLLEHMGSAFVLLCYGKPTEIPDDVRLVDVTAFAEPGMIIERYALMPGAAYLIRPDQYVAARFHATTPRLIAAALLRAKGGR